jgi:hypothetical protein
MEMCNAIWDKKKAMESNERKSFEQKKKKGMNWMQAKVRVHAVL